MPRNEFICDCHPIDVQLVENAKKAMQKAELIADIAGFFSVVGDMTRCKILFALKESPMCVCDLASVLSMTKSSISHQLNKLKTAGFVKCEKSGKQVFYSLDDDHVCEIFDVSLKHIAHKLREESDEE